MRSTCSSEIRMTEGSSQTGPAPGKKEAHKGRLASNQNWTSLPLGAQDELIVDRSWEAKTVTRGRMESCGKRLEFGWTDKEEEWELMQNDNDDDELGRRKKGYPCLDPLFSFSCSSSCHPCPWLVEDDKHSWGITVRVPFSYPWPSAPRTDVPPPTDPSTAD